MPRGAKIDAGLREEIANAYLSDESVTAEALAEKYCLCTTTIRKIIKEYTKYGNGIKPDRRKKLTDEELDRQHAERMAEKAKAEHPRTSDWMDHITPLHQRKMELENAIEHKQAELENAIEHKQAELENAIEHKQAELEKAKQEYRDFLATLWQLLGESV